VVILCGKEFELERLQAKGRKKRWEKREKMKALKAIIRLEFINSLCNNIVTY